MAKSNRSAKKTTAKVDGQTKAEKPVKTKQKASAARTAASRSPKMGKAPDLDLRTLVRLSMGEWSELADLEWPPDHIRRWLAGADVRQVRGMLLTTLHRWHEMRRDGA